MIKEPGQGQGGQILRQPRQRRLAIIAGVVVLVLLFGGSIIRFYIDLLWFHELNYQAAFWRIVWTRVGLGVGGGVIAAVLILVNLEIARMAAPKYRFVTPAGDVAERYRSLFQPYARWANLGIAVLVGLLTGLSTSQAWSTFQLWRNAQPFGIVDAQFGRDVSFFVFSIPFQRVILAFLFGVVIVSALLAALGHLLNGSIEPEPNRVNIRPVVKAHLSVLVGVLALLKAWSYWLDRYELVFSSRGVVAGASYTDVNAQLPAFTLLTAIAVVAAVILFANIRFQGWLVPGIAIGLWALSSVIVGAVFPAAVQRLQVLPQESTREAPYIQRNIDATREAFALDRIEAREFGVDTGLTQEVIEDNRGTVDNIRLWDPDVLIHSYRRLQAIRTYYDFREVDIDRYVLDGQLTQVMIAPREVDVTGLDERARNWVNTRLTYTHGYGVVAIAANSATPEGIPDFLVRDLPPRGRAELIPEDSIRNAIYYGQGHAGYVIPNSQQAEIHYPEGDTNILTHYEGEGGIPITNPMRRFAFAAGFADFNLMISPFITGESKFMFRRDIFERVRTAAPFLHYDRDAYLVATEGGLHWIIDGYTLTDRFPYAQPVGLGQVFGGAGQPRVNYMRNSVKAVVDAYDGSVRLYVTEPDDPLIATYQQVFPEMFIPGDDMSDELRAHLRYPNDLFTVQAEQYRTYHLLDPGRVYTGEDVWEFPIDPVRSTEATRAAMQPYRLVMKLPGEEAEEYVLMLPFTPKQRPNLNGWVAARSDPGHYGQLLGFSFPRGDFVPGPENVSARIEQDPVISEQVTLWTRAGSRVLRGEMSVIPIGSSLIYVQPIYLQAERAAIPELRRVIVVYGDNIGFQATLEGALQQAMAGGPPAPVVEDPDADPAPADPAEPAPPAPAPIVGDHLDRAAQHFQRADEALRQGDLATYQRENQMARQAVEQARQEQQATQQAA